MQYQRPGKHDTLKQCWPSVADGGPALVQRILFAGTCSGDIDRDSVCPSVVITALSESV